MNEWLTGNQGVNLSPILLLCFFSIPIRWIYLIVNTELVLGFVCPMWLWPQLYKMGTFSVTGCWIKYCAILKSLNVYYLHTRTEQIQPVSLQLIKGRVDWSFSQFSVTYGFEHAIFKSINQVIFDKPIIVCIGSTVTNTHQHNRVGKIKNNLFARYFIVILWHYKNKIKKALLHYISSYTKLN